jgi:hypothetical protein
MSTRNLFPVRKRMNCNTNRSSRCRTGINDAEIIDPLMETAVTDQNSEKHVSILSVLGQSMLNKYILKPSPKPADIHCSVILRNILQNLLFTCHSLYTQTCLHKDITLRIFDVETLKFGTLSNAERAVMRTLSYMLNWSTFSVEFHLIFECCLLLVFNLNFHLTNLCNLTSIQNINIRLQSLLVCTCKYK